MEMQNKQLNIGSGDGERVLDPSADRFCLKPNIGCDHQGKDKEGQSLS